MVPEGVLPEGFKPLGDEYLRFVVEEVKPFVDSHYSTWGDAEPQEAINQLISSLGWDESQYMYRFFPGHSHSENDWKSRLDIPVRFLLQ